MGILVPCGWYVPSSQWVCMCFHPRWRTKMSRFLSLYTCTPCLCAPPHPLAPSPAPAPPSAHPGTPTTASGTQWWRIPRIRAGIAPLIMGGGIGPTTVPCAGSVRPAGLASAPSPSCPRSLPTCRGCAGPICNVSSMGREKRAASEATVLLLSALSESRCLFLRWYPPSPIVESELCSWDVGMGA
jgi:hypothetical protein